MQRYVIILVIISLFLCNPSGHISGANLDGAVRGTPWFFVTVAGSETPVLFEPTHMVRAGQWTQYQPGTGSRLIQFFHNARLVTVLDVESVSHWRGETSWSRVRNAAGVTGWLPSERLIELDQSLFGLAMNRIDNPVLVLPRETGGNHRLVLEGEYGQFQYEYGMNTVLVRFFRKGTTFDDDFYRLHNHFRERFFEMEVSIAHQFDIFTFYDFGNTSQRKSSRNNVVFVDAFAFFTPEEMVDQQRLVRDIFFTTSEYTVRITIFVPNSGRENEVLFRIMNEAPCYFTIVVPDLERFINDLLGHTNHSETAAVWFMETEEILAGIFLE